MNTLTPPTSEDESTGLPILRSWPVVYSFVLAVFVLWIVLLVVFELAFS